MLIILATAPALASAATVSVGSATTVGSTVTVPINVSGAPDIGAMTIALTYDSSLLSATGVSKGTITSDALLIAEGTINSSGGISDADKETMENHGAIIGDITDNRVNISMISTNGFVGDDGTIATITFSVVGSGTTSLTLTEVLANETATCDPCTNETVVDPASYPEISITKEDAILQTPIPMGYYP
jgi:energy-converting hydrogenase Eha subunit E